MKTVRKCSLIIMERTQEGKKEAMAAALEETSATTRGTLTRMFFKRGIEGHNASENGKPFKEFQMMINPFGDISRRKN